MKASALIPQRYPLQLLDRMIEVEPGIQAVAEKLMTINEWFFKSSTMTGKVLLRPVLLEILAQTGAVALLSLPEHYDQNVFFGGIKRADFYADVHPGDQLTATVTLTKLKHQIGRGHGVIECGDKMIVSADLIFAIQT